MMMMVRSDLFVPFPTTQAAAAESVPMKIEDMGHGTLYSPLDAGVPSDVCDPGFYPGDDPGYVRPDRAIEHALARILEITLRPSSQHPAGRHAYTHFMADFDEIRKICRENLRPV
jgi:hypothetical protein